MRISDWSSDVCSSDLLAAPQVDALAPEAIGAAFDDDAQAGDIAPLVDQLAGRAGAAALFRLAAVESDVPERAVRRVAPLVAGGGWPRWRRPGRERAV